jgi:Tol biopolymer transport system component
VSTSRLAFPLIFLALVTSMFSIVPGQLLQAQSVIVTPTQSSPPSTKLVYTVLDSKTIGEFGSYVKVVDPASGFSKIVNIPSPLVTDGAAASPDGAYIAFTGTDLQTQPGPTVHLNIYVMDMSGQNLRQVTHYPVRRSDPGFNLGQFAWSPDSKRLLLVQIEYNNRGQVTNTGLFTVAVNGTSDPQEIRLNPPTSFVPSDANYPAWSPDGRHALVIGYPTPTNGKPNATLYSKSLLVNIDVTSGKVTPFASDHLYFYAAWSPDGKHVLAAYRPNTDSIKSRVVIMDADGSNPQPIALPDNLLADHLVWSPDGKQIGFVGAKLISKDGKLDTDVTAQIYTFSLADSKLAIVDDLAWQAYVDVPMLTWVM